MIKYFIPLFLLFINAVEAKEHRPLRFIDAIEIPLTAKQQGIQIGGLSSLYFDEDTNTLFSITDDKGQLGGPIIHHFSVSLTNSGLAIQPSGLTKLVDKDGTNLYPEEIIDAEAFDQLANGNWLVASEGIDVENYFSLPMLYEFSEEGRLVGRTEVPKKFLPKQSDKSNFGIRPNDAFEGLSLSPDNKHLFLMNEKALLQDGEVSDQTQQSVVRIVHKQQEEEGYSYHAEYAYELSKLPNPLASDVVEGFLSISDILTVSSSKILVVEKSFLTTPDIRNTVRLYLASITDKTTQIQNIEALAEASYSAVDKTLWTDLDDYAQEEGFPKLDNVEGIIWGPLLANGNQTLLVVTDNNFSKRQKTLIYAFEVVMAL